MRPGMKGRDLEAKIFVARRVFKRDVLRIHLSDFDKGLEKKTKLRYQGQFSQKLRTSHVTDPEHDWSTGFVT